MDTATILDHTYRALTLVLLLSAPSVLAAAVTGLLVSVFQAVTQIQDQSVGLAAKFVVVTVVVILTANWVGGELFNFADQLFKQLSYFG